MEILGTRDIVLEVVLGTRSGTARICSDWNEVGQSDGPERGTPFRHQQKKDMGDRFV